MRPGLKAAICAAILFAVSAPATATEVTPVSLDATEHLRAELVLVRPDGTEMRYTPADLERLPTYSLTTTSPWRDTPARFEGVLLADLLAANGLAEADAILVTAENDFTSILEREAWTSVDFLVATRVDGRPHTRRARGPIQFIVDHETYETSPVVHEQHLVWMASRIEAAD